MASLPVWIDVVEIVGWSLLHFLWQGCVIGGLYAIVRQRLPIDRADLRYGAGLGALVLLALCMPVTMVVVAGSVDAMVIAAVGSDVVANGASVDAEAITFRIDPDAWMPWLVGLWAVGVGCCALRALREIRGYSRIVRESSRPDSKLEALLADIALGMGYLGKVRLLVSDRIDTPTLFGWIRPVVLLPAAVALQFPREQLRLILAHELGHLRRYDHYANLAQSVIETLLFYHPVVHWISRDVRHEREVCCDRLVLGEDRKASRDYVRALAALQEFRLRGDEPLVLAASGGELLDRVQRILSAPEERPLQTRSNATSWVVLTLLLGATLLVATRMRDHREALETLAQSLLVKLPAPAVVLMADLAIDVSRDIVVGRPTAPRLVLPADIDAAAASPAVVDVSPVSMGMPMVERSPALPDADSHAPAAVDTIVPSRIESTETQAIESRLLQPLLIEQVVPAYPNTELGTSAGHVEFDFTVAADGTVHDIQTISGDSRGDFAKAARAALAQWRFAPISVTPGMRLRQDFMFRAAHADDDGRSGCKRRVGSHICTARQR